MFFFPYYNIEYSPWKGDYIDDKLYLSEKSMRQRKIYTFVARIDGHAIDII